VIAVALLVTGAAACSDDDDAGGDGDASSTVPDVSTQQSAPPTTTGPLDAEGNELAELLASSRDATFHATYEATTPPQTEGGQATAYTLELFRSEGRTRQDTITELEGGDYLTAGILVDGASILCTKQGSAEWLCSESADAEDSAADGVFGTLVRSLGGVDVTASDDVVGGRSVRCFAYETGDGSGSMCLTPDGIPVRITGGDTELVLTDLEETIDDDVFVPPAEPAQAEASGDS
jgi:hypothetical protein